MSTYFEQVEHGLSAAVRRHAHMPWYRRLWVHHPRTLVVVLAGVLATGPALAVAGVFDGGTDVTVVNCSTTRTGRSAATESSCVFVLSDGRRFSCPSTFARPTPSVSTLERASACIPLKRLEIGTSLQRVSQALATTRRCLSAQGFRAVGSPVPPSQGAGAPQGELMLVRRGTSAFIAFYGSEAQAVSREPSLLKTAKHFGGLVERRGAIAIVWTATPSASLRHTVETCVPN